MVLNYKKIEIKKKLPSVNLLYGFKEKYVTGALLSHINPPHYI